MGGPQSQAWDSDYSGMFPCLKMGYFQRSFPESSICVDYMTQQMGDSGTQDGSTLMHLLPLPL